jgi:hypothetical protein
MSDYPIPKKETWFIVDSTKLSEYQRCLELFLQVYSWMEIRLRPEPSMVW